MSGHSKWAQIKHKKAAVDIRRAKIFGKIARAITLAAREKGKDPQANAALRATIEKAREVNMPQDNIDRAIKKGAGGAGEESFREFTYIKRDKTSAWRTGREVGKSRECAVGV